MKGLKIENIRDPKWIGKKIIVGELSVSPDKLVFVGNGQICTENRFGTLSLWPIDCYDWHEWIEPEEEKKPKFPFKVGDFVKSKNLEDGQCFEIIKIYPDEDIRIICLSEGVEIGSSFKSPILYHELKNNSENYTLCQPPKKKKTYSMALLKFKEYETPRPFELLGPYSSKEDIPTKSYDVLQFPAVTKNGIVLQFEVDDDS